MTISKIVIFFFNVDFQRNFAHVQKHKIKIKLVTNGRKNSDFRFWFPIHSTYS